MTYSQRLARLTASINASGLDAVAINPGPTMNYLTGVNFHLMERPVVILYSKDHERPSSCRRWKCSKVGMLPYKVQAFFLQRKPRRMGGRLQKSHPIDWFGWEENWCGAAPIAFAGVPLHQGGSPGGRLPRCQRGVRVAAPEERCCRSGEKCAGLSSLPRMR